MDGGPRTASKRDGPEDSPNRVAHTLTACCRCRTRKTRCDPGLPRCGPCERTNSHCEYFDPTKGTKIPRNYVVHLQHKVRDLEKQLADLERDDVDAEPEDVMRSAAAVYIQETNETKYLGPSSGTPLTRLVMQLAKNFTDSKSISDIVPHSRQRMIKEQFAREDAKPTSKVYPLVSNVAAEELPTRDLTNRLVQLFYLKVHPMYPLFHEPTFDQVVEEIYNGGPDPQKNFCLRMVIAISLQKMDTQYAGLADSYYLAALKYLEASIKPMNLATLQCFALIAGYSLLTPTRTAVYYIMGLAVRLAQALGLTEEKTLIRGRGGKTADPLEVDMRRRLFWCVLTMDYGLAHSLGRPAILATGREHLDVGFFQLVDDEYITREGILPAPQASRKKWLAIHFYKMRLLQLEIRRKLYLRTRTEPKDDNDPWFHQMEAKLVAWRDASPDVDGGSGLTKTWFVGRYNTMMVFLFRPSPQVPRPSTRAAIQCYDACEFNIYMTSKQIETGSVDLTWIFTQAIFMAINTMLWSLSYSEVRQNHPQAEVEKHLHIALDSIMRAAERWPGVLSALELYRNLIEACLKVYEKSGDVPISAGSPADSTSVASSSMTEGINRSRTTSPSASSSHTSAAMSNHAVHTPPEQQNYPSYPYSHHDPSLLATPRSNASNPYMQTPSPTQPPTSQPQSSPYQPSYIDARPRPPPTSDPSGFAPLPATFTEMDTWNPAFSMPPSSTFSLPPVSQALDPSSFSAPPFPYNVQQEAVWQPEYIHDESWNVMERPGMGLTQEQQVELMRSLETEGRGEMEGLIRESEKVWGVQRAS